jgi:hypothetical protein
MGDERDDIKVRRVSYALYRNEGRNPRVKVALKTMVILWAVAVVASFGGLVYITPSYGMDDAFSQALHERPDPGLQHWFHWLELSFAIGLTMTFWLWRVYRNQYGRFWSGKAAPPSSR